MFRLLTPGRLSLFFFFSTIQYLDCEQRSPSRLTLVLSGYFRISPRKAKQDGRCPLPWTTPHPDTLIALHPAEQGPAVYPPLSLELGGTRGYQSEALD